MGIYARRAQHVPTRVLARRAAVDRLAEQDRCRPDHDPGGDPERHRGNESCERGGDQDAAGGAPVSARPTPTKARPSTAMVRIPPTPAITRSACGESPLSMLNALKRPAKSSWASGMGMALAAPSAARAAAAKNSNHNERWSLLKQTRQQPSARKASWISARRS